MIGPIIALRAAIITSLRGDPTLTGLLGGAQIYEDVPRTAVSPFVTFGEISAKDWSTSTETGVEQVLTLNIWSKQTFMRRTLTVADRINNLLQDTHLTLNGHCLVTLHLTNIDSKYEDSGRWLRTSLRFRAVTEPNS
jgi:Protein of unknown function (DUF3168)